MMKSVARTLLLMGACILFAAPASEGLADPYHRRYAEMLRQRRADGVYSRRGVFGADRRLHRQPEIPVYPRVIPPYSPPPYDGGAYSLPYQPGYRGY